jgi:hypothetical protein
VVNNTDPKFTVRESRPRRDVNEEILKIPPQARIDLVQESFVSRAVSKWNMLPVTIKRIVEYKSYSRAVVNHYISSNDPTM